MDEAVDLIRRTDPELVFLDIEMPVQNGFEIFEQVGQVNFDVIFTTAFDQYAVKAFEYSAVDYLLKPIKIRKLVAAVDKVRDKVDRRSREGRLETLRQNLGQDFRKVVLPTQEGYQFLQIDRIIRCEADSNYTNFFLADGSRVFVSKTLKLVEGLLNDRDFFRIHQSHLINLRHMVKYIKGKSGQVQMADGSLLDVSVRRKGALLERIRSLG